MNNEITTKECFKYILDYVFKGIYVKIIPLFFIMVLFVFNDVYLLNSTASAYTRLVVIIPSILLLFLRKYSTNKKMIYYMYNILLFVTPFMMFLKVIIHQDNTEHLASSIIGIIMIMLLVSMELRIKFFYTALYYFISLSLFIILLFTVSKINYHFVLVNIIPVFILGLILNYAINRLICKLVKVSILLEQEKLEVDKHNIELEKLNKTKNRLFSVVAHDLKSPFNIIIGFSDLLNKNYNKYNDEKRKLYINKISESSNFVFTLLENLLTWSSLQIKGNNIEKERVNVYNLINEQLMPIRIIANKKNINILNLVNEDLEEMLDKYSVSIIISNLVSNAIKFSYEGNKVEVKVEKQSQEIQFCVIDYGVGISNDIIDKLFSMEVKNKKGTNDENGSGLGLMLCKELVENKKGKIWVESKEGEGSKFYFSIPI